MAYSNLYARVYTATQRSLGSLVALGQIAPVRIYLVAIALLQALIWWQAISIRQRVSGNLLILHYNIDFGGKTLSGLIYRSIVVSIFLSLALLSIYTVNFR